MASTQLVIHTRALGLRRVRVAGAVLRLVHPLIGRRATVAVARWAVKAVGVEVSAGGRTRRYPLDVRVS